jgi:hypothetical protein
MDERIEREFKLAIPDEAAWRALRARLGGPSAPAARQVNHFFDTEARDLHRGRVALRLREERGRSTLALKGPELVGETALAGETARPGGTALASRPEEELALEPREAAAILAGERSPLEAFRASLLARNALVQRALELAGRAPPWPLGAFENERTRLGPLAFPPGSRGPALVFELDRTTFPGGRVERELEVELPAGVDPAGVEPALRELFASLGIPVVTAPSKAARFFAALDSGGKGAVEPG